MDRDITGAMPPLPKLVLLMSIPLFLGYAVKNALFPPPVFVVMYSWAILAFVLMPLLCLAEVSILVKAVLSPAGRRRDRKPHLLGLGIGALALVAALVVRLYG